MALGQREAAKWARYPELASSTEARLAVLACETGGRWSSEAASFVAALAAAKARSAPRLLRRAAEYSWHSRWSAILAVAAQASLAATLMGGDPWAVSGRDGHSPALDVVLDGGAPCYSRLPARAED